MDGKPSPFNELLSRDSIFCPMALLSVRYHKEKVSGRTGSHGLTASGSLRSFNPPPSTSIKRMKEGPNGARLSVVLMGGQQFSFYY